MTKTTGKKTKAKKKEDITFYGIVTFVGTYIGLAFIVMVALGVVQQLAKIF